MRTPRHQILLPGLGVHKMWRAHNKEFIFESDAEKQLYLTCVSSDYQQRCSPTDFRLHAFCIMGNHVHEIGSIGTSLKRFSDHID